jgi:hypothetical protein
MQQHSIYAENHITSVQYLPNLEGARTISQLLVEFNSTRTYFNANALRITEALHILADQPNSYAQCPCIASELK